jgi:polyphosphate kinase
MKHEFIPRDISWLSFNARVLQEANDPTVTLKDRIRFLGIFSNNLDEFFRVRVATLKRMVEFVDKKKNTNIDILESPQIILDEIQRVVLKQQSEFARIWGNINKELIKRKVLIINERKLNTVQKEFVRDYFDNVVRPYIIPLMIENLPELPYLRDKSLYLAIVMKNKMNAYIFCNKDLVPTYLNYAVENKYSFNILILPFYSCKTRCSYIIFLRPINPEFLYKLVRTNNFISCRIKILNTFVIAANYTR